MTAQIQTYVLQSCMYINSISIFLPYPYCYLNSFRDFHFHSSMFSIQYTYQAYFISLFTLLFLGSSDFTQDSHTNKQKFKWSAVVTSCTKMWRCTTKKYVDTPISSFLQMWEKNAHNWRTPFYMSRFLLDLKYSFCS